jgi:YhcH/YjgK/YiaL family protein
MKKPEKIRSHSQGLIEPDDSIIIEEYYRYYAANPDRWEKAFKFLRDTDLKNIEKGKYEIDGEDLYASVSEYTTKNEEDAKLEAHRKYADIQYIISGEEKMGLVPLTKTEVVTPYDDVKDVCFLKAGKLSYHIATPKVYFVFFPEDAHKPSIKVTDNEPVKKVVLKVRLK